MAAASSATSRARFFATRAAVRTKSRRFVDRTRILVAGGDGGGGIATRFRDSRVENGPPNGGDGGDGGNIVLVASHNVGDLHLSLKNFRAKSGANGRNDNMHGIRGDDLLIPVPPGTLVHQVGATTTSRASQMEPAYATKTLIGELLHDGEQLTVAKGGRGGRGNASFWTATRQHAMVAEDGAWGEVVTLQLGLKSIADIGLVGYPNAGKSSLLRALSNATPAVAPYPFTTLHPHLGRVQVTHDPMDTLTIADIPGLVDGAHANRGLGHAFLRHVERTSLLCFVLDLADAKRAPIRQLTSLLNEVDLYKPGLSAHPCIILANKADAEGASSRLRTLRRDVARLRLSGSLLGLIVGDVASGEGDGGEGGADGPIAHGSDTGGGATVAPSAVTAVSALHAKNLPRVVERMHVAVAQARGLLASKAEEERAEEERRIKAQALERKDDDDEEGSSQADSSWAEEDGAFYAEGSNAAPGPSRARLRQEYREANQVPMTRAAKRAKATRKATTTS